MFTRPDAVPVILDNWAYLRQHHGLQLFGSVILENPLHFVAHAPGLDKYLNSFK